MAVLKTAPTRFLVYRIWDQWSWRQRFCVDLSAKRADDVGITPLEFQRVHQPIETHEISQMAVIRSCEGCRSWIPGVLVHCILKSTWELSIVQLWKWVTLFALRGIWMRVVLRLKIHDYWPLDSSKTCCFFLRAELNWHSLRKLICWTRWGFERVAMNKP